VSDIWLENPLLSYYGLDSYDYKNCTFKNFTPCKVMYNDTPYPATLYHDYVTALIDGKYIKYKLNRETHLLELQSEIDLNSIESRLAALEAK
jgi:hypothetical protein